MPIEGVRMANVSKVRQQTHLPRKGAGTTPHEKCSVGERLYSQVHVCNHARCAANDPEYNVKSAVPPRKFLVAKKHAYGGVEEKGEKKNACSGSSTTFPDHHWNRSHALNSLTNSVLKTESGSNGKGRSNGLRSNAHSALQTRRTTLSSDTKNIAERRGRPTSTHASNSAPSRSSTGRSSVTFAESQSTARKSRLSSAGSVPSATATEQSKQWEGSASPASSITSIKITQIVSTSREEQGKGVDETQELDAAAASSPTASVGSNLDTEISSLKETVILVEEVGIFEQPTTNFSDFQSPASSLFKIVHNNSENKDANCDSPSRPSPSVDLRIPVSESLTPSTQSMSFASTAPDRSSLTTTPASALSSSSLRKPAVGREKINNDSSSPSVDSRPVTSESLTSLVTSLTSGPRLSPTSTGRSSRTTTPPSSSDKLARKLISKLNQSSKVGSPLPSSSHALVNEPSRIPKNSVSPAPVVASPAPTAPTNASTLAKRFITDLQAKGAVRKSTKGVRSIELRGGKAQNYSTTTVTSWNVTTTTVETSMSVSEITTETTVLSGSGSVEAPGKPEQSSKKESETAAARRNASTVDPKSIKGAPTTVKFAKNARSFEEVHAEPETVALKHGEVAERRLSEEYMTNHALEGVVRKISEHDHRVKVLVHAFETLATITDAEALAIDEKTLNQQLAHESLSATTIAV